MRVVCPACEAIYEVPEALVGQGTRRLRCARCQHEWDLEVPVAGVPASAPTEPEPQPEPEPAEPAAPPPVAPPPLVAKPLRASPAFHVEEPRGANRGAFFGWVLSLLVVAALAGAAWQYHDDVMRAWPPSERVFGWFGITPPPPTGSP